MTAWIKRHRALIGVLILGIMALAIPASLGLTWVRSMGILSGNAVIFSANATAVEKFTGNILHDIYGDQVQVCDGHTDDVEINAAIAAVCTGDPDGATVDVRKGTYEITDEILLYHDLNLRGAGHDVTIFKQGDSANIEAILYNIPNGFNRGEIRDLCIDGNNANNTTGYGIWLRGAWYSRIVNVYVHDCETYGMRITSTAGGTNSGEVYLEDCYVTTTTGTGVGYSISGAGDCIAINCSTYNNSGVGFHLGSSANTLISCHPYSDGSHGVQIDAAADHCALIECHLDDNGKHGIIVNGDECRFIGNYCFANSVDYAGYDGIRVAGTYNTFIGNTCINLSGWETQIYGIQETVGADYNTYIGNVVDGITPNLSGGMLLAGTHSVAHKNIGFTSESSGTAELISGNTSVVVAHGLSETPDDGDIVVMPCEAWDAMTEYWTSNYNSENFTIWADQDPTDNITFTWRAETR